MMRFNAAAFDSFLGNIGQQVEWRRSYACACLNPTTGQADPKHKLCNGKGRLWDPPKPTVVGVASQKVQAEWQAAGLWESGDMVLSVPQNSPLWEAGQFDRILMRNSTDVFSQALLRGGPNERLLFQVKSFTRCFWLDANRELVEGGLPDVDSSGNLSWPRGGEPPPATQYSLTGDKFDEYWVFGAFPSDRNQHQGMRLPKKLIARKWDLFGRANVR